ncbi:hypothetical protein QE152_g29259 [Popillia japonica]|uniref:CASP-like protein n=1 Tax=Popillia japonica TaxID=7064 RepID=A0AAW1JIM3_POPJA
MLLGFHGDTPMPRRPYGATSEGGRPSNNRNKNSNDHYPKTKEMRGGWSVEVMLSVAVTCCSLLLAFAAATNDDEAVGNDCQDGFSRLRDSANVLYCLGVVIEMLL